MMKKRFAILICVVLSALMSFAQQSIPAHFDECVELLSTVWRLSGAREYNNCRVEKYAQDVDATFGQFKEHPVVELARQYRKEFGISYDAVVSYGLHLKVMDDAEIVFDDSFMDGGDDSFDRWPEKQKEEFLKPLIDFYHTSKFHQWFLMQQDLYSEVEKAFQDINQKVDYDWFNSYFGKQSGGQFRIVLSLLVGQNNYGCSAKLKDGSDMLSPVIGCCETADNGDLYYESNLVLPIIIHEFCHHYCNRLNRQNWSLMDKSAEKIFLVKADQLSQSAYGSARIMMNETFVRASVIRYMASHYPQVSEEKLIKEEEKKGFVLTQTLCDALKEYEQQRGKYATMADFMPSIAKAVNDFDLKQYVKEEKKVAKLNATYKVNIKNGAKNIPSGIFTVVIKFSKPMVEGIALNPSSSDAAFPEFKGFTWPNDKTLEVKFLLKPSTHYGITVLGNHYVTKDGHSAGKNLEVNFTTGK